MTAHITASDKVAIIRICTGSGCVMSGSLAAAERLEEAIAAAGATDRVRVVRTGCHGLCDLGPIAVIDPDDIFYPGVTEEKVAAIIDSFLGGGAPISEYLYRVTEDAEPVTRYRDMPFNRLQHRIVLRNCGIVDPESIDDARAHGLYDGLGRALTRMSPQQVIDEMKASGLRGRGGAGFPTGVKWESGRRTKSDEKYVIANGGAFINRSIMEGDPHSVLEGMIVCAYAVGDVRKGYIYVRDEYQLAVRRLELAVEAARQAGLLGNDISGSGFDFDIEIRRGAGAFICGESTALMFSIEGRRGMPRATPPHSVEAGLFGKPTVMNNVETLANVGWILSNGPSAYAELGSGGSRGTKVFALTGKVRSGGLVEVPMGVTVDTLVHEVGGGCSGDAVCKAVQIGGPSGGCLPAELFDTPMDYEALEAVGAVVGCSEIVVMDEHDCMVDAARYSLSFTQAESCGKCVPCRIGTKRMLEIVTRICKGEGQMSDIDTLERLGVDIQRSSLCGLGRTAPNPVLTTLRYFRHEFEEHIVDRRCRAGQCKEISTFRIIAEVCTGCGVCKKHCPVDAISGIAQETHIIADALCVKCGLCELHCPFEAIEHS